MNERISGSSHQAGASVAEASVPAAVRDLTKVYGTITAVDHISFKLQQGATVALLGGNGAGKTTTIAMLLGLVMPTSGEVRVFGADMSKNRGAVAYRLNFQNPYVDLPARLPVLQNLTVYSGLYGPALAILLHHGRIIEVDSPSALTATNGRDTLDQVFLAVVRGRGKHATEAAD